MRELTINRWNWSEKAHKWVYVKEENGERVYIYSKEPPKEFIDLSKKLYKLNKKLMEEEDHDKNIEIFERMMKLSDRMQNMRK